MLTLKNVSRLCNFVDKKQTCVFQIKDNVDNLNNFYVLLLQYNCLESSNG